MNRLTRSIARACEENRIGEKWLVAPNLRAGNQWLESVARSGTPVMNVRVRTLRAIALSLAAPAMAHRGVELLHPEAGPFLVERAFARVARSAGHAHDLYIGRMTPGMSLFRAIFATIGDLRRAGLAPGRLDATGFEVRRKGQEITGLLEAWDAVLAEAGFVDDANLLAIAVDRLGKPPSLLPAGLTLLLPADTEPDKLERDLLDGMRAALGDRFRILAVDEPGTPLAEEDSPATDASLLRHLPDLSAAPEPRGDGTFRVTSAAGAVNEVRAALRACLAGAVPLDEVELLHSDAATYIPLVYETFARLAGDAPGEDAPGDDDLDGMPVTFAEGVPARYSRPGRALAGLVAWARDGYRQENLARLIQEGVLLLPGAEQPGKPVQPEDPVQRDVPGEAEDPGDPGLLSYASLARSLRSIPIFVGRERYLPQIDGAISQAALRDAVDGADREGRLLPVLRAFVADLLAVAPEPHDSRQAALEKARRFLEGMVRSVTRLDNLAAERLSGRIRRLARLLESSEVAGIDVVEWLADLPGTLRVGGSAPRPGKLHVAPLSDGGYSGRRRTILVGLDDDRFPRRGGQDPLLLDGERAKISAHLATSHSRLEKGSRAFEFLLARLRGRVTFSFPCHDIALDRELFPSPLVGQVCRLFTADRTLGIDEALRVVMGSDSGSDADSDGIGPPPAPAGFAPANPAGSLDEAEAWLHHLCAPGPIVLSGAGPADAFPWSGRGDRALDARRSSAFTPFDGRVGQVAPEDDPLAPGGPVMSSSGLEQIAACPLRYFFDHILGIRLPAAIEPDETAWLDPARKGSLLHDIFHRFWQGLLDRDEAPSVAAHGDRLSALVARIVAAEGEINPPRDAFLFGKDAREMEKIARIFLREEETYAAESRARPFALEAAIGIAPSDPSSPIDRAEPVAIPLGRGRTLRIRGRVDRIDRTGDGDAFRIWDYKTGGAGYYERLVEAGRLDDRVLQGGLYVALAQALLREKVGEEARAEQFGFFFPGPKERGRRLAWPAAELAAWKEKAAALCGVVSAGCFLATDNPIRKCDDCRFCDFTSICGDLDALHRQSGAKIGNAANDALAPIRKARGDE